MLTHYIVADDHGYDGHYINSIIELTGSEKVLDSRSYNGLSAWWIDYNNNNKKIYFWKYSQSKETNNLRMFQNKKLLSWRTQVKWDNIFQNNPIISVQMLTYPNKENQSRKTILVTFRSEPKSCSLDFIFLLTISIFFGGGIEKFVILV